MENGIYLCDDIDTPFILGIFRPRIYLPGTMDEQTMKHVLAHERAHLKRYDHLWKPLGFLLLTVHWFNPVPVSLYWQDQCPIPDHILDEFHEFYADLAMLSFEFDESCLYQLIDDQYFLVKRDEHVYLVNRWAQDKGLNAVWYIVELHHE